MTYRQLIPLFLVAVLMMGEPGELMAGKKDKEGKKNKPPKDASIVQPIVTVNSIVVQEVSIEDDQLIAHAVVTLDVTGQIVTREIEIPLDLSGSPGAEGQCDILNLAVGPIDLDLLGLIVELDDCFGGPVTVDIVAVEGGGLLGDLLCEIAGALNGGVDLGEILDQLTDEELAALEAALTSILNEIIDDLLTTGAVVPASHHSGNGPHTCDILTLAIPEGLSLNVLGLQVDTSGICLAVYAQRGGGNLLGNLLCSLTELPDRPGNHGNALSALVKNVKKVLKRL